ncbi:zinc finger protein 79 isoform 4-T6 [Trichechus inunguis]
MLEEGVLSSPDPALPQEESTGEEGMAAGLLTARPQGSMSFSSMTVAFTQEGCRHPVLAPRDRYKEGIPEKSRNLVLLGLPVSQPGLNSQLEQREEPWMLEGEGLRSTCPDSLFWRAIKPIHDRIPSYVEIHRDAINLKWESLSGSCINVHLYNAL